MATTPNISFGTSGHRGIIGESFSVEHVLAITQAICDYVKTTSPSPKLCLGYDPRQGNSPTLEDGSFTQAIASVCAQNNVDLDVFETFTPTPIVSWTVKQNGYAGGIILTASHNPKQYNGLKFNTSDGAPAAKAVTDTIQDMANIYFKSKSVDCLGVKGQLSKHVSYINTVPEFVSATENWMASLVFSAQAENGHIPSICIDTKHGTTATTWQAFAKALGFSATLIHEEPLSDFNGIEPNPTKTSSLTALRTAIADTQAIMGVSNDPDGDRHIILDETGEVLTPEESSTIILDYFVSKKIPVHGVASTVASSQLLSVFCEKHGLPYHETAVGFKYFSDLFNEANKKDELVIGIESSGGFSTSKHSFDKCGFLPAMILFHILRESGDSLSHLKARMSETYGSFVFLESEATFDLLAKQAIVAAFRDMDLSAAQESFDKPIRALNQADGLKLIFDNGWVLFRLSGTEPIARIYVEFRTEQTATKLMEEAQAFFAELTTTLSR